MRAMVSASAQLAPFIAMLLGCSTGAQIESKRIQTTAGDALNAAMACRQRVASQPEYAHLKTKLYLGGDGNYPLEFTTNTARPTKQESGSLYKYHADAQPCAKNAVEGLARAHPLLMLTLVENLSARDKLYAEAVKGGLTWGQFNQGLKDLGTQLQLNGNRAEIQIAAQLQNQHAFEVQQRQHAAAAFQQWNHQQQVLANQRQAIDAMNAPRTTNCQYIGNTAQCQSR